MEVASHDPMASSPKYEYNLLLVSCVWNSFLLSILNSHGRVPLLQKFVCRVSFSGVAVSDLRFMKDIMRSTRRVRLTRGR